MKYTDIQLLTVLFNVDFVMLSFLWMKSFIRYSARNGVVQNTGASKLHSSY